MAVRKGQVVTLIQHTLVKVNVRREYVNETSCYTTLRYDLVDKADGEQVRIARVQRDGTVWYTPLASEERGLCPQYRVQGGQEIIA